MPTTTFTIGTGPDDGYVTVGSPSYPPSGTVVVFNGSQFISASRTKGTPNYTVNTGVLFFNTASLTGSAPISAVLRVFVTGVNDAGVDNRALVAGWYDGANRPVDAADWSATPETTAHAGTDLSTITVGATLDLALDNLDQINVAGYTGIRLHIDGGQPLGINQVVIASFEQATNPKPQLIVTAEITTQTIEGSAALGGSGSLATMPVARTSGTAAVQTTGALVAEAVAIVHGAVILDGTEDLAGDHRTFVAGDGSVNAAGALVARATVTSTARADLMGMSDLEFASRVVTTAAGLISGTTGLAASPFNLLAGSAALAASGQITGNGAAVATGAALVGPFGLRGAPGALEASGDNGRLVAVGITGRLGAED